VAHGVCPIWVGYFLSIPLRKLVQNPKKILSPYLADGMKVLDIGCAMGFFSLQMARIVGPGGRVICVDVQQRMIDVLVKRARRAGLLEIIETRVCGRDSLGIEDLDGQMDFACAFAVAHEVPDSAAMFSQVYRALKQGGRMFLAEPKGHISEDEFGITVSTASKTGFEIVSNPDVARSRTVLWEKPEQGRSM